MQWHETPRAVRKSHFQLVFHTGFPGYPADNPKIVEFSPHSRKHVSWCAVLSASVNALHCRSQVWGHATGCRLSSPLAQTHTHTHTHKCGSAPLRWNLGGTNAEIPQLWPQFVFQRYSNREDGRPRWAGTKMDRTGPSEIRSLLRRRWVKE